jgi:cyclic-di-AMP phosphodiesterase PgpH
LAQSRRSWQEPTSAAILTLLSLALIGLFLSYRRDLLYHLPSLALVAALFLVFLFAARVVVPDHTLIPYVFPLSAYALTVAALFGWEVALVTSLPLAVLSAYGMNYSLDLTLYYSLGSIFGIFALGQARRMMSFAWAGIAIAFSGLLVVLVFRLPLPTTDPLGIASLAGAAAFNGLASASLTIVMQYFLSQLLGMTTPMQLVELTRPDNPLLRMILQNSPGTYQHSLLVANLAEQAAERIGADTLLVRVGALYHDSGKALNPQYFIENQMPGLGNPHDELDPVTSAGIIIRHVTDGLEQARKHRLPRQIQAFIAEHHGTMLTRYQYVKAVKAAGSESLVDPDLFRYPGPNPRSRETALLMLADGSEAQVRAEKPKNEEEMRAVIKNVIDTRIQNGNLDDSELTLHDLKQVADSFATSLRGLYHPRVTYPKLDSPPNAVELPAPALRSEPLPPAVEANPKPSEGRS